MLEVVDQILKDRFARAKGEVLRLAKGDWEYVAFLHDHLEPGSDQSDIIPEDAELLAAARRVVELASSNARVRLMLLRQRRQRWREVLARLLSLTLKRSRIDLFKLVGRDAASLFADHDLSPPGRVMSASPRVTTGPPSTLAVPLSAGELAAAA